MKSKLPIIFVVISACVMLLSQAALGQNMIATQAISSGSTTAVASNGTMKLFSTIGQPMAYSSGMLTENQAGFLQASNYVSVDNTAPLISYGGATQGITQGSPGSFSATITDNIKVTSAKLFYRPVSSVDFSSADLSASGNAFSVAIQEGWHDAQGMEYYFTASDGSGNETRSPATGSYYAYLTSPSVIVPQLSAGKEVSNYHIIAMPFSSEGGDDIANVFGTGSGLPESSDTRWRLATYDNALGKFIESSSGLTKFERGKGYWFITRTWPQGGLNLGQKKAPPNNRALLYSFTLKPGWNQIGNPYPLPITWSDVQSFAGNPTVGGVKVYKGGWTDGDELAPFEGGFVMNEGTSDIQVRVPFVGQASEGGRSRDHVAGTGLSDGEWRVPLYIFQEGQFNKIAAFGMAPRSRLEEDDLDDYNPPAFVNSPAVNFYREGLPQLRLAKDMVPPAEKFTWTFNVSGANGTAAELRWSGDPGSGNGNLFLLDERTLQLINMREQSAYSFILSAGQPFRIYFGSAIDEIATDRISITGPGPNPAINRSTSFNLGFPQGERYRVQFTVYSATAAVVHADQEVFDGGIHHWHWIADDTVPAGMYYYRIVVQSTQEGKMFTGKILIP